MAALSLQPELTRPARRWRYGGTAHYVTEDLDEGPIIERDVVRVRHANTVADLQRRGADAERAVLSRAVLWRSEDCVIRHGRQTIVFIWPPPPVIMHICPPPTPKSPCS